MFFLVCSQKELDKDDSDWRQTPKYKTKEETVLYLN